MIGKLKWYRQEIKHDVWDYDSAYEILLFKKDGRDLLVHLNKSGFVFVMDKLNGNLQNIWRLSDTINFAKDVAFLAYCLQVTLKQGNDHLDAV